MKKYIFGFIFLLLVFVFTNFASASLKTIQVHFSYPTPAQAFNLYMDGKQICNTNTPDVMNCTDVEIPYGVHMFTMTAVVDNVETNHSPAYVWVFSPEQGKPPVVITFTVTVDGENVELGPAN